MIFFDEKFWLELKKLHKHYNAISIFKQCKLFAVSLRLKEELIRELVKNSRTSKRLNETYLTKIQKLELVSEVMVTLASWTVIQWSSSQS